MYKKYPTWFFALTREPEINKTWGFYADARPENCQPLTFFRADVRPQNELNWASDTQQYIGIRGGYS